MKRFTLTAAILILMTAISALAAPRPSTANVPAFPGTLANATYVYVASYDGDQFNTNLLPEDRQAISAVQDAIQKWGKLTLVYQPSQADIVIVVPAGLPKIYWPCMTAAGQAAITSGALWAATVSVDFL